jgi:hypothetical protein
MGIVLPLLGEVTALRAFFLFLFFYSNDSNSMSTWSTFGAGMLLSNLGKQAISHAIEYNAASNAAPTAAVTASAATPFAAALLRMQHNVLYCVSKFCTLPLYCCCHNYLL